MRSVFINLEKQGKASNLGCEASKTATSKKE